MSHDVLNERRRQVLNTHFESEVEHDWDTCLATFDGTPRYEIMPTGQVYDGDEAVRAYHQSQRVAFPDQRHENVRLHFSDDSVIAEFDLLGTNTGPFLGLEPTHRAFRVPTIAVFSFEGDKITNERVYLDLVSLLTQIGRTELVHLAAADS